MAVLISFQLYAALVLATCGMSLLCYSLPGELYAGLKHTSSDWLTWSPEFLPGKRALAIGLCLYHSISSTILFQTPRFIPHSFGPLLESYVPLCYRLLT